MKQVAAMRRSRYFRRLEGYFLWRREALLRETLTSPFEIAKNRGAIEEIAKFLQHPELQALYLEQTQGSAEEPAEESAGVDQSWRTSMGLHQLDEELS